MAKAEGEELWKPELRWNAGKMEVEEKEALVSNVDNLNCMLRLMESLFKFNICVVDFL